MAQIQLFPGVIVDIIDNTTLEGLQPTTLTFLRAAGAAAIAAGLDHIQVTAGAGSDGHVSHYDGTEADIVGFNADGSRWTQDQRVAVAGGARGAGANRFGFYSNPDGSYSGNSLHIGTGPGGRNQNATWGFGGATSGEGARAFTNPAEAAFSASIAGAPAPQHGAPVRAPQPQNAALPAQNSQTPAAPAPGPLPEPETPVQAVVRSMGEQFSARAAQPAAETAAPATAEPSSPLLATADIDNSRQKLGQMKDFLVPAAEDVATAPQPMSLAREGSDGPLNALKKPDFGKQSGFAGMFRGARPAPLGGGIRIRG